MVDGDAVVTYLRDRHAALLIDLARERGGPNTLSKAALHGGLLELERLLLRFGIPVETSPIMPFGKFKNWSLRALPRYYIDWAINQPWLKADLRDDMLAEVERRLSGPPPDDGDDAGLSPFVG